MKLTCKKCGDHELVVTSANAFFHEVQTLSSLVKIDVDYLCPGCGQKTGQERVISKNEAHRRGLRNISSSPTGEVKRHLASLSGYSSGGRPFTSLHYPSVYRPDENVLYPTFEGNVQDGTVIDRHGNPDLLLKFAERYFKLFRSIMPTQSLPNSLIELMPALHLLVVAVELGLKAYLIRNDKRDFGHSLEQLYGNLDLAYREEIETRFANSNLAANLVTMGIAPPTVKAILSSYDNTYGGQSKVYMDTRYYAEPTTTFKPSSDLHGASLVKSQNPYPIRHSPDDIQIRGRRTTDPPPWELRTLRSPPMPRLWRADQVRNAIWQSIPPSRRISPIVFTSPLISSAYAGTGLGRRSSIKLKIFWNKLLGTATSANWNVTYRP